MSFDPLWALGIIMLVFGYIVYKIAMKLPK